MNNIKQPICYFLIGLPGSGKSTWADDLIIKNPELEIVSMDYFIEQEAVRQNKKYNDVYREFAETAEKLMKQKLSEIIKEKKSFIWDQINISENIRRKKIARLKQNKYENHAIAFSLNAAPNPFVSVISLKYSLMKDGPVSISVFDEHGT